MNPAASPHAPGTTPVLMIRVILGCLPGAVALHWLFGPGVWLNLLWAVPMGLALEAWLLRLRGRPMGPGLADGSALTSAVLLALCLPPAAPWWLILVGMVSAIVLARHLYGGLGMNPFNPAMVGYAVLLVSFPVEMTRWFAAGEGPELAEALWLSLGLHEHPDALTGATPLDRFRELAGDATALAAEPILDGRIAGQGWELVNLAFLSGGLWLLWRGVIRWHIPVAVLAGLALTALPFWLWDPVRFASPQFHLFSGAAMFCAFFIATDPVSAATTRAGRLFYGFMIGVLIWVIRSLGAYPDGVAFAVLLLNLAVPAIDYFTRPGPAGSSGSVRRNAS